MLVALAHHDIPHNTFYVAKNVPAGGLSSAMALVVHSLSGAHYTHFLPYFIISTAEQMWTHAVMFPPPRAAMGRSLGCKIRMKGGLFGNEAGNLNSALHSDQRGLFWQHSHDRPDAEFLHIVLQCRVWKIP